MKTIPALVLIALVCWLCLLSPVTASPNALIVVLLPGTSLQDWQDADAPALHRLLETGAVAVLNTRTAHQVGKTETEPLHAALLTLGAGSRAAGTASAGGFVPAVGATAALFERRTGQKPSPGVSVCLEWPALVAVNRDLGYDLQLGTLADTLTARGISITAGGGPNSNWLAVGSLGIVQRSPRLAAKPGECLIWDAGSDVHAANAVIADAAGQIAALHGRLLVLSPAVSGRNRALAPVLVWGPGVPTGLLVSASTRRSGLTANTDFAPTVASYFGVPRTKLKSLPFGFAWSAIPAPDAARQAAALSAEAVRQSAAQRILPYLAAIVGFWILAVTARVSRPADLPRIVCLVPAAALVAALFAASLFAFGFLALTLLAIAAAVMRGAANRVLVLVCAAVVLALCCDMVTGNHLMHRGLLGYSALEGARYYGLGNEAMGLLLGAALITVHGFWRPGQTARYGLAAVMAGIVLLLGSVGAKAGGVLVSLAIFGTFFHAVSGRRWTPKAYALLVGAVCFGIAAAALGDAFIRPGSGSHLGEAVRRIAAGGVGEGGDIVRRKLAVEGRLAYHSAWAALLWPAFGCCLWLWKRSPSADTEENALRSAGTVGIVSTLLLNDAGVVAAAIFTGLLWTAAVTQKSPPVLGVPRTGGHTR